MAVPLDRTKQAVQPFRLALSTQRQGEVNWHPYTRPSLSGLHGLTQHGLSGLGSLWDDIVDYGQQAGENWLDRQLAEQGIGGMDIISIQNAVGAAMDQLSAQYYPLRDSGNITVAVITRFQQAFQTLINSFCAKAQSIGSPRALAGCSTIQYWGGKWIADRDVEKAALSSGGTVTGGCTVTDPVSGQCISFVNPPATGGVVGTMSSYMPLVLGAVFVFAMFKSSKKW